MATQTEAECPAGSCLQVELAQQTPFSSREEEVLLSLMRTADVLSRTMQHQLRDWNLSSPQYNVLRILRGARPDALSCSQIGQRMIAADPDITRLLARLKSRKLIEQHRDKRDKRVVLTEISKTGLSLLTELDPIIKQAPKKMLEGISADVQTQLIETLTAIRRRLEDERPPTCDGNH